MSVVEVVTSQISIEIVTDGVTPLVITNDVTVIEIATIGLVVNNSGSASSLTVYEVAAASSGVQTLTALSAISRIDSFYINGLRQPQGQVTFAGPTITVPASLSVITGDILTTVYA